MSTVPDLLTIERGCISAPAGCGKTHLIATTLSQFDGAKPILVLTHTNAGVAALKKKLTAFKVPKQSYRLSTIDGWAIRLISSFPFRSGINPKILEVQDPRNDYDSIKFHALKLLNEYHVDDVISANYSRLLVDEYQDCMKPQHDIVVALSRLLPTCVFGDDLQCIFSWSGQKVDWDDEVLQEFPLVGELDIPHRWNNVGCNELGQWLLDIRKNLKNGSSIDLNDSPTEVEWVCISGINDTENILRAAQAKSPTKGGSAMIICSGKNRKRQQDIARHTPGATVIENVDLTDFINFAESFCFDATDATDDLIDFASTVMTGIGAMSLKKRANSLIKGTARKKADAAESAVIKFKKNPCPKTANTMLVELNKQTGVRPHRPAILSACLRTLNSCNDPDDFRELAIQVREKQRVIGREVYGRVVGSTLLLKGLEADVVILLDTAEFSRQDLYVALTRGARKIVVCSEDSIIQLR